MHITGGAATAGLHPVGIALALGSSLLYAIYLPVVDRLQRGIPSTAAAAYVTSGVFATYIFAAIGTALAGVLAYSSLVLPLHVPNTNEAWIHVLILALVSTVIAFKTLFLGLATLGACRTSIIGTAEPFFTTLLAIGFLGESLRWPTLAGGACIAAAVIVIAKERTA